MKPRRRRSRFRRFLENLFLLGAIAGIGAWLGSNVVPEMVERWESWSFDQKLQEKRPEKSAAATSESPARQSPVPRPLPENTFIGRLTIPRLRLTSIVREGTSDGTLFLAAGHIRGTGLPGSSGNVAIAAHRDTLFRALADIRKDDRIRIETLNGTYMYQVDSLQIVKPEDVEVLKAGPHPELTLVTCYPFRYVGSAPDRFIVKARQIDDEAPSAVAAAAEPAATSPQPAPERKAKNPGASFEIAVHHSRQLAPGISMGVTEADSIADQMGGWLYVMPDRRTIWLRDQRADSALTFYQNGSKRKLMITSVADGAVSGYLVR